LVYAVRVSHRRLRRKLEKVQRHARPLERAYAEPPAIVREPSRVERLAYTRTQAAEALGISRSTFNRRVLPLVETIEMPWGAKLIPADELQRLVAERRRPPTQAARLTGKRGRPAAVSPELVARIRAEHAAEKSLGQIARGLNDDGVRTAQGGRRWWPSTVRTVLLRSRPLASA
jgi:Recombinase